MTPSQSEKKNSVTNMCLVTNATVDYVPQALVTLRSARNHCSFRLLYMFVADATAETLDKIKLALGEDSKWMHVFGPQDLGEEKEIYLRSFEYYNPFEIANFAKYVGVSHVLKKSESSDICVYIDADTFFLGDVCPFIENKIQNSAVYLSPHILGPLNDNLEHDILIHGWINAGISAFNKRNNDTFDILNWLIDRIAKRGFCSPHLGMFVDQLWMSTLPILFPNKVIMCDKPGINVAYWNLIERPLTENEKTFYACGEPLLMFHFSGFLPNNPRKLSKHSNIAVLPESSLEKICALYRQEIGVSENLRPLLSKLTIIPHCKANLYKRLDACFDLHHEQLYKTMVRPGIFTKFGTKIDAVIRKFSVIFK